MPAGAPRRQPALRAGPNRLFDQIAFSTVGGRAWYKFLDTPALILDVTVWVAGASGHAEMPVGAPRRQGRKLRLCPPLPRAARPPGTFSLSHTHTHTHTTLSPSQSSVCVYESERERVVFV